MKRPVYILQCTGARLYIRKEISGLFMTRVYIVSTIRAKIFLRNSISNRSWDSQTKKANGSNTCVISRYLSMYVCVCMCMSGVTWIISIPQLIYDRRLTLPEDEISRKLLTETLLLSIVSIYGFTLSTDHNYHSSRAEVHSSANHVRYSIQGEQKRSAWLDISTHYVYILFVFREYSVQVDLCTLGYFQEDTRNYVENLEKKTNRGTHANSFL